jgi:hypothetical protein
LLTSQLNQLPPAPLLPASSSCSAPRLEGRRVITSGSAEELAELESGSACGGGGGGLVG